MTPEPETPSAPDSAAWLRHGHAREAEGTPEALAEAVRAYDVVIALLRTRPLEGDPAVRRELGGAWMNRGNALQKQTAAGSVEEAVRSYDRAIELLQLLPIDTHAPHRNCLGSAWMNRGHALLQLAGAEHLPAAIAAHETAVALLAELPHREIPAYRLNFAGAQLNLANALLLAPTPAALEHARSASRAALELVAHREAAAAEFADLGLKARRAWCAAIGGLLVTPGAHQDTLAHEASDLVDDGLALARRWEAVGVPHFRPIAARLFRYGATLYRLHQPQFLAEFLEEQLSATTDAEFQAIALEHIDAALRGQVGDPILTAGDPASERRREIGRELGRIRSRFLDPASSSRCA